MNTIITGALLVSLPILGCTAIMPVQVEPVRKPVTSIVIECVRSDSPMNRILQSRPWVHRDGYDGEVLHQYQWCHEV